jgi:hypothetical protein
MDPVLALARVESSSSEKSPLRKWYESLTGETTSGSSQKMVQVRAHLIEGGQTIRAVGEAGIVGGLLGAAHAELKNGLDIRGKYPLDAIAAGVSAAGAIALAGHETGLATEARNVATSSMAIFSFRKTHDWMNAKKGGGKATFSKMHGDGDMGAEDEDPIVAAAKNL